MQKEENDQLFLHVIPQKPNMLETRKLAQTQPVVRGWCPSFLFSDKLCLKGNHWYWIKQVIQKTLNDGRVPDEWACKLQVGTAEADRRWRCMQMSWPYRFGYT